MPTPYAQEFTADLNQEYLASLLNPLEERRAADVARARKEGSEMGLIGQASTGSRVGAIESGYGQARGQTIAQFNRDVAEKKYSERMLGEERAYRDVERKKDEDFRREMAKMGYEHEKEMRAGSMKAAREGMLLGVGGKLLGAAAGAAIGGPWGAKMGADMGGSFAEDQETLDMFGGDY